MILAASHLVIATDDVPRMAKFFKEAFGGEPHYGNDEFTEFVLPSRFRVAFFRPVGKAAESFSVPADRSGCSFGVTVEDVEAVHAKASAMAGVTVSGPPKEHPWGEKSFLLTDPDGNRWEVTQTPSKDGMLVNREM